MCFIMNNPEEDVKTSNTHLIVTPLRTPSGEHQQYQLLYINSVDVKHGREAPLMVVPVPNPHGLSEGDFPLFPLSKPAAQRIVRLTASIATPYRPESVAPMGFGARSVTGVSSFGAAPPLVVQEVGDYSISVAPTLHDLETRAPWVRFGVRAQHSARIVADMRARYPAGFGFIIAEGHTLSGGFARQMRHAGFGVAYRDGRAQGVFFPTSHEPTFDATGRPSPDAPMDVTCVALGGVVLPGTYLPPRKNASLTVQHVHVPALPGIGSHDSMTSEVARNSVILRGDDSQCRYFHREGWRDVKELLSLLPCRGGGELHAHKVVQHAHISVATLYRIESLSRNADLYGRRAVQRDEAAVRTLLQDVDAWLGYRKNVRPTPTAAFLKEDPAMDSLFWPPSGSYIHQLGKLDFVLALLARQLADPGICDRVSELPCPASGGVRNCGGVAYHNLDMPDTDLDEWSYARKETDARYLPLDLGGKKVDTLGCVYVRICATPPDGEDGIHDRMVQDVLKKYR